MALTPKGRGNRSCPNRIRTCRRSFRGGSELPRFWSGFVLVASLGVGKNTPSTYLRQLENPVGILHFTNVTNPRSTQSSGRRMSQIPKHPSSSCIYFDKRRSPAAIKESAPLRSKDKSSGNCAAHSEKPMHLRNVIAKESRSMFAGSTMILDQYWRDASTMDRRRGQPVTHQ